MSFRITKQVSNGINLLQLEDEKNSVRVSVLPDFGAMLHEFDVPLQGSSFNIISNYENLETLLKELPLSYRSSKLSPFACRIKEARYNFEGHSYEFAHKFPDGSAIHGLLFNKKFEITRQTVSDLMASVELSYDYHAEDPGYPFHYTCTIRYSLFPEATLQVQTVLTNTGSGKIPMADGWHPYFRLNAKVDDCTLYFPATGMLEFDAGLVPTGKILPFNDFNRSRFIAGTQLDNCFCLDEKAGPPICILTNSANGLSIEFTADENYPFLQIYIPDDRRSIAIENLSGAPDCFNNKMGLLVLEPGSQKTLTLHYQVKTTESA